MSIFSKQDHQYMQIALQQAELGAKQAEVPVGAVLVDEHQRIIAKAYNQVECQQNVQAHAEMLAVGQACQAKKAWRLDGCTVYITLQPCMMCLGTLLLARVARIVYATTSPVYGIPAQSNILPFIYRYGVVVQEGLCEEESIALLQNFFVRKRKCKNKGENYESKKS